MTDTERAALNRASAAKIQSALDALAALADVQLTSRTDHAIILAIGQLTWERDSFTAGADYLTEASP